MKIPPRLFIASSQHSSLLAEDLAAELNSRQPETATPWSQPGLPEAGRILLSNLLEHARTNDFVVVLLTGDDELVDPEGGPGIPVPRDNCIFELGLFLGALGVSERCIVFSALEKGTLARILSDIGGLIYKPLPKPSNWRTPAGRRAVAEELAAIVEKNVNTRGRYIGRPALPRFSIEDILERESDRRVVRAHRTVVVKEKTPPETKLRHARVVTTNMLRPVNYLYLFNADSTNDPVIVEMIRSLIVSIVAEVDDADFGEMDGRDKRRLLERVADQQLSETIERLRGRLFIELVQDLSFDQFCIHNAELEACTGYLKIDRESYALMPPADARARFGHDPYRARGKRWPTSTIFDPYDFDDARREEFSDEIKRQLPPLWQAPLIDACFTPPPR